MKIYNKKMFVSGVLMVLLGVLNLVFNIIEKDIDASMIIVDVVLFVFGFSAMIRSLSYKKTKEDKLDNMDERNCLIKFKSQSKSFQITQVLSSIVMFLLLIMGKVSGSEKFIFMGVGMAFLLSISMLAELFTAVYYEAKN